MRKTQGGSEDIDESYRYFLEGMRFGTGSVRSGNSREAMALGPPDAPPAPVKEVQDAPGRAFGGSDRTWRGSTKISSVVRRRGRSNIQRSPASDVDSLDTRSNGSMSATPVPMEPVTKYIHNRSFEAVIRCNRIRLAADPRPFLLKTLPCLSSPLPLFVSPPFPTLLCVPHASDPWREEGIWIPVRDRLRRPRAATRHRQRASFERS